LDNAATTQKPVSVINSISDYYLHHHANVHRGVHELSQRATDLFEASRSKVRRLLNGREDAEVIFTKGSTESINLVAYSFGRTFLKPGDRIVLSAMEHHANIVPWQVVCQATGAQIVVAPINDAGELLLDEFEKLMDERVKLVGICHVSNSLGTVNPIGWIAKRAHAIGAKLLVDGAQALAHIPVDVQALDIDFYTLASHKLYGPTGIGALYGKRELLEAMPPYQTGGGMIRAVTFEETTYAGLPDKFEPGTPNIADSVGLGEAIDFLLEGELLTLAGSHEHELTAHAHEALSAIDGVRLVGTAKDKSGIVSFVMESAHPHDIGTILDAEGVAIRAGHHCCQPLMKRMGVTATARASFAIYNTHEEVEALARAVRKVKEVFG
jgi:cysteine desulfurase/selenocysteine lyase